MSKIIVTGEVADLAKWEASFRTHGELFNRQRFITPVQFATRLEGNEVAMLFDVENVGAFFEVLESEDTVKAMEADGIKRDTVKVFVVDKEYDF